MSNQPEAVELEEAVIGAMLIDKLAIERVIDILKPECFYDYKNATIYKAMATLYKQDKPIDLLTISRFLKEQKKLDEIGGAYALTRLTDRVGTSANIEFHARIIVQQFLRREIIRLSQINIADSLDETKDVFALYGDCIKNLENAVGGVVKYEVSHIGEVNAKVIAESRVVAESGQSSGIPTGFFNIDNFTNGWQKTDLIILAGRPAMGKSVCGLAFAINPAMQRKIPTAIFSLEMSKEQLVGRTQATLSGIDSSRVIKKQLTLEEISHIERTCYDLYDAPIYIDDTAGLTLMELKNKARKLVRDNGVQLIVIDYLQLMVGEPNKNGSRELEVSSISKGLKNLAKELNIPIIALSQLNRAVEGRSDKKPLLSDLRESGSIEQDADMVIFCYRPEYYNIENYELGGEVMSSQDLMILVMSKHRSGSLGELRLGFNGNLTKLENYDSMMNRKRGLMPNPFADEIVPRLTPNKDAEKQEDEDDDLLDNTPF